MLSRHHIDYISILPLPFAKADITVFSLCPHQVEAQPFFIQPDRIFHELAGYPTHQVADAHKFINVLRMESEGRICVEAGTQDSIF